jgi:hypothetical protein
MRRAIRHCAVSMSLVAMLPACAPTADRWSKDGSTVEARNSTFNSCRSSAHARLASAPPASTYQQVPAAGGVIGILVGALVLGVASAAAQGAATNASIDSCMRESGFVRPQPAVNSDGYRNDSVKTNTAPGPAGAPASANPGTEKPPADCRPTATSPGPRTSLMANQPPPTSCISTQPAPS